MTTLETLADLYSRELMLYVKLFLAYKLYVMYVR